MTSSLRDIKRAIKGFIIMSADLDAMYTSFLNNQVPGLWEKVSFASLKTLGSWVSDLCYRVDFMRQWLLNGQPATFPLPVFFFPQVSSTVDVMKYICIYVYMYACIYVYLFIYTCDSHFPLSVSVCVSLSHTHSLCRDS